MLSPEESTTLDTLDGHHRDSEGCGRSVPFGLLARSVEAMVGPGDILGLVPEPAGRHTVTTDRTGN